MATENGFPVDPRTELMGVREVYTYGLIRWLGENREFASDVRNRLMHIGDAQVRQVLCRTAILELIGPLPHPPGSILELHVRLLEAALHVIDWARVAASLSGGFGSAEDGL